MKTEKQYADELVEMYKPLSFDKLDEINNTFSIHCAINDVTNTIKALTELTSGHYTDELLTNSITYYQTVLQMLKERL